jgi:hypothetical protein
MPHNRGFGERADRRASTSAPSGAALPLGVYHGPGAVSQCATFEEKVGILPWRLDFGDQHRMFAAPLPLVSAHLADSSRAVDTYPIRVWKGCERTLLLGVPMIPACAPGQGGEGFAAVAAGTYDSVFTLQAEAFLANGFNASNAMIRIGWEFNGDWFAWSASNMAREFVAAFRRIVKVFRATIPGLPTMWNPTRGDLGLGNLGNYWPGAEYATCAALDVYDAEWQKGLIREPKEFDHIVSQKYGLAWLADFARLEGVQVGLGEWGLCPVGKPNVEQRGGGDDPVFVTEMVKWIKDYATGPCIIWDDTGSFSSCANSVAALRVAIS